MLLLRLAAIYLGGRVVTTVFLLLASANAPLSSRFGRGATLFDYILAWDARWYWIVATSGYPSELPRVDSGEVGENAWAFMPVFPFLARGFGALLGHYGYGALLVAFVAGFLCCLVLYGILREKIGDVAATWAVVFFSASPLAVFFQVGYAETLFLLFVLVGIWCLQRRRYGWLYLVIPLMGFSRPGVLAFALLMGLFGLMRWFRRREEPLHRLEVIHILALGAIATAVGFSWQFIAAAVTGNPTAYFETELAWRRLWVSDAGGFVPFEGWIQGVDFWSRTWGLPEWMAGVLGVGTLVAIAAILLFEPHVRRLGPETRLWAASYLLYLVAVFFPQSSIFRLLFPLAPLWGAVALPRSLGWRIGVVVACLAGQWWWIWNMYGVGMTFWQIP